MDSERNQERRYACMTVNQLRSETRRRPKLVGSWIAAATKDALINALLDDDRDAKLAYAEQRLTETSQAPQQQIPLSEALKIIMDRITILEAKVEALSDKVDEAEDKIMVSIG